MTLPKPRSIADEGGLEAHMGSEMYAIFCLLDDKKLSNSAIGKAIGKGRDTVRRYRKVRQEEAES